MLGFEDIRGDGSETVIIQQKEINYDRPMHLSACALILGQEGQEDRAAANGTGPYVKENWQPGVQTLSKKFLPR